MTAGSRDDPSGTLSRRRAEMARNSAAYSVARGRLTFEDLKTSLDYAISLAAVGRSSRNIPIGASGYGRGFRLMASRRRVQFIHPENFGHIPELQQHYRSLGLHAVVTPLGRRKRLSILTIREPS